MTSRKNSSISIKQYKKRREWNVGIILFSIVLIYLIVTIVTYATGKKVSAYEVRKGSIVKDNSYTGLVIREESTVECESDGYINYYQNENSKVKAGNNIYAISPQKLETKADLSSETGNMALSEETQENITLQMQNFNENYNSQNYSSIYSLKNELNAALQNAGSQTKTAQLDAVIADSSQEVSSYQTSRDGIIVLAVDGLENLTKTNFTEDSFDRSEYESRQLEDQMEIKKGEPAYKLVTSENWSVIVQLSEDAAKELKDTTSIKTRIDKDSETMWADFSIIEKEGAYYGCLDFDNSMIRYVQDRYLNIELILEDETGLKIPKTSVTEMDFFVIPKEYVTTGGNTSSQGVLIQNSGKDATFQTITVYDMSEETGEVYLSTSDFKEGTVLIKPESSETYTIKEKKPLKGVYNINKGYAVFKKVDILCENDEYYIVKEGDDYSLNNYDHIVQDAHSVREDEIVFQ